MTGQEFPDRGYISPWSAALARLDLSQSLDPVTCFGGRAIRRLQEANNPYNWRRVLAWSCLGGGIVLLALTVVSLQQSGGFSETALSGLLAIFLLLAFWNCRRWANNPSLDVLQRLADTQEQRERLTTIFRWLCEIRGANLSFVELGSSGSLRRDRLSQVVSHQPTLPRLVQSYYLDLEPAPSGLRLGILQRSLASFLPHSSVKSGHGSRTGTVQSETIDLPRPMSENLVGSAAAEPRMPFPAEYSNDEQHYLYGVTEKLLRQAMANARERKILSNKAWPEFALLEAREIVQSQPTIGIGDLARQTGQKCREKYGQRVTVGDDTIAKLLGEGSIGGYAQFRLLLLEMKSVQNVSDTSKSALFPDSR